MPLGWDKLYFWINVQHKVLMLGWGFCRARRRATEINGQINIEAPQGLSSSVLAYVDIQALSGFP